MKYSKSVDLNPGIVFEALGRFKKAEYAARELGHSLKSFRRYMRRNGIREEQAVELWDNAIASLSDAIYENASKFMDAAIPKGQVEKFTRAHQYAAEDDLVGDLVLMSSDVSIKGLNVRLTGTQTRRNRIKRFAKNYDMLGISAQMFQSAYEGSNIVVLVKKNSGTIKYIKVLELDKVKVTRNGGVVNGKPVTTVTYTIPDDIQAAIKKGNTDGVDPRWVEVCSGAGLRGRGEITFSEQQGEFVYVLNRKGHRDKLVDPEMSRSFPQIEIRKLKWDGEFSVDFHIKNIIHQIIIDKSKGNTNPFATIVQSATQAQLDKVRDQYKGDDSKAFLEVTTPEVDHKFHAPDPSKVTPAERFTKVDEVIERNFGFSKILTTGEGGTYSGGYIFTKQLIARVSRWRKIVASFWEDLYDTLSSEGITVSFDPNALKEAAQVLKEEEFLLSSGVVSPQTIADRHGLDNDFEVERKKEAFKDKEGYSPTFEKSQGIVADRWGVQSGGGGQGEPGAPPTDGPEGDKEGAGEPPKP